MPCQLRLPLTGVDANLGLLAPFDDLGELALLRRVQQRDEPDLMEVLTD